MEVEQDIGMRVRGPRLGWGASNLPPKVADGDQFNSRRVRGKRAEVLTGPSQGKLSRPTSITRIKSH